MKIVNQAILCSYLCLWLLLCPCFLQQGFQEGTGVERCWWPCQKDWTDPGHQQVEDKGMRLKDALLNVAEALQLHSLGAPVLHGVALLPMIYVIPSYVRGLSTGRAYIELPFVPPVLELRGPRIKERD